MLVHHLTILAFMIGVFIIHVVFTCISLADMKLPGEVFLVMVPFAHCVRGVLEKGQLVDNNV